jgi:hypothetical protein
LLRLLMVTVKLSAGIIKASSALLLTWRNFERLL